MSGSVAQLLLGSRLAPHFTYEHLSPDAGVSSAKPMALSEFASINPFDVMAKQSSATSTSDTGSSCSKKSCCS